MANCCDVCRYKREAFRGSEFAPGILAGEGIKVTMKVAAVFFDFPMVSYI